MMTQPPCTGDRVPGWPAAFICHHACTNTAPACARLEGAVATILIVGDPLAQSQWGARIRCPRCRHQHQIALSPTAMRILLDQGAWVESADTETDESERFRTDPLTVAEVDTAARLIDEESFLALRVWAEESDRATGRRTT